MTITALEIQEIRFSEAKKGYDPGEVDDFLERVAGDVDTLNRALSEAAARIKAAEARVKDAETRIEEAEERAAAAQAGQIAAKKEAVVAEKPVSTRSKAPEISEQDISNAFIAAQKSAEALKEEARKEADRVYREAESKGRDIVREALAEKQKTLGELDRLRESCEHFRTEYLSLLKHFQSDAQKRLTDFDDIVPRKSTETTKSPAATKPSTLIKDNDAAVAATSVAAVVPETVKPTSAAPEAVAPTIPVVSGMLEDVDDLDIEEID